MKIKNTRRIKTKFKKLEVGNLILKRNERRKHTLLGPFLSF